MAGLKFWSARFLDRGVVTRPRFRIEDMGHSLFECAQNMQVVSRTPHILRHQVRFLINAGALRDRRGRLH